MPGVEGCGRWKGVCSGKNFYLKLLREKLLVGPWLQISNDQPPTWPQPNGSYPSPFTFSVYSSYLALMFPETIWPGRVQRKSVLQPAIWASCRQHVLAHKSFQLAPKPFLIGRIDNNPSVIWISPKNSTCPSGKLRTKNTSPIAKSTSPGLSDMTFFARCQENWSVCEIIS